MKILNSNYTYIVVFAIFNIFHFLQGLESEERVEYLDQHVKEFVWINDLDGREIKTAFSKKIEVIREWLRSDQVWFGQTTR